MNTVKVHSLSTKNMMVALNFSLLQGDYAVEENSTAGNSTGQNTKEEVHLNLQSHHILIAFFHTVIIILGVPGNAVVIWIAGFKMKRTVNSIWFLNLACADLVCCLCIPFVMYTVVHNQHWPFGFQMCRLIYGVIYISSFCAIFLLMIISLDRVILVAKPVWCQNHRKTYCASLMCFLVIIVLYTKALVYCNSCLNPLIYVCIGQDFKVHMCKSFRAVMEIFMTDDLSSRSVTTFTPMSFSINYQISHI
ncbi:C5a anaphylatoxin chemotactic receptor 1-like [Polypterus senegalus]|uniref:C5a anaphylatoxin chemotactic receptor 1-like n=1 Tax=Polypterus senegalus TaxID=55291 RepID=UPI001962FFCB|nr:C5a anaphylatoxin chemotactic receptor 1-like [Polypterus senegalus]